jgi:adenosine tuberculosinyltransferase
MDKKTFFECPAGEIARLMETQGSGVCGLPINGTRRWFELEHPGETPEAYLRLTGDQHCEVYRLIFEHGIHTLLAPVFNPLMERRGSAYIEQVVVRGLASWLTSTEFTHFCNLLGVRVNFYGDWRRYFTANDWLELAGIFDSVITDTRANGPRRLFFGVCANSALNHLLELAFAHQQETGMIPDLPALTRRYYSEDITPANLYLSCNKPAVFDVPLLIGDRTDLYFAVSPLLYLEQQSLRAVLFDHLYLRQATEPAYAMLPDEARTRMRTFYRRHRQDVLGVGRWMDDIWYPEIFGADSETGTNL